MTNAVLNRERKQRMLDRTKELFSTHENYMLVSIQRVKSTQFKDIASQLPSGMKILFAKNKVMKKVLKELDEEKYKDVVDSIKGNVLVVFFDTEDPRTVLSVSNKNMKKAFAAVGDVAECPVIIPAGATGLGPEKIGFFQTAKIQTKINKGKIDVASDHVLIPAGGVVGISDANMLQMLNIMPFEFGLNILRVYEGAEAYGKSVLLIDETCIEEAVREVAGQIAALSLGAGVVTQASVPYEISNAHSEVQKMMLGLDLRK